ncbi:hypothetical protein T265_01630 [Opisthorchis viverrini]|uniref:Peptidase A1 domain-containing protein n=1 Tax=Opisthorchis viverrini TaxID=6198 RepID=A0A075A915_OPIVI|nr:hypothetical protein T265_01630 [Opisthorchis viverrini]KER32195.1 hypothetical protein T265_01630 [Opisthorchis viverrini]
MLPTSCHPTKQRYDVTSKTCHSSGLTYTFSYLDGVQTGNVVTDNLVLGGHLIPEFLFVEVLHSTCQSSPGEEYDGLFGMRKPPGDSRTRIFDPTLVKLAVLAGLADKEVFTFQFCGIEYDDQIICELCNCLIDTGTPTTIMPHEAANRILRNSEIKDNGQGLFHVLHEDLPRVKDLKITIGVYVFVLPPKALLIRKPRYNIYGLAHVPHYQEDKCIIGVSVLRSFVSIFDEKDSQMGFAVVAC